MKSDETTFGVAGGITYSDYSEAKLHLDRLNSTSRSTQSDKRPGHLGARWLASKNAFLGLK